MSAVNGRRLEESGAIERPKPLKSGEVEEC